jgi:2'-5' RNA ligase
LVYNLFLAVRPSPGEAETIARLAEELNQNYRLDGKPVRPQNLHVTLVEFAKLKEPEKTVLEKVPAAARRVALPAFQIAFDRALSFSGQKGKALVLTGSEGVAGLVALQQALIAALHKEWLKISANSRYTPHMTLLYADREIEEISLPPLRWTATELVFIRSLAGKSTHIVLDRWPLRG